MVLIDKASARVWADILGYEESLQSRTGWWGVGESFIGCEGVNYEEWGEILLSLIERR